jgi:anti-sigma28 factor (negative regulator of flagellin synthesis)
LKQYQQIKSNHKGPRSTLDYNSTSKSNPTTKGHAARSIKTVPANEFQPPRATQHARLKQYQKKAERRTRIRSGSWQLSKEHTLVDLECCLTLHNIFITVSQ